MFINAVIGSLEFRATGNLGYISSETGPLEDGEGEAEWKAGLLEAAPGNWQADAARMVCLGNRAGTSSASLPARKMKQRKQGGRLKQEVL